MKRVIILLTIVLLTISLISTVNAIDKSGAITGAGVTGSLNIGSVTESSAGSDTQAQGGNVSFLNLSANVSTIKWHGYVGNVTANLSLGSGSNILFNFGMAAKSQIKTIFASQNSSFDFSTLVGANLTDVDVAFNWTASDADSGSNVFNDGKTTISQLSAINTSNLTAYVKSGSSCTDSMIWPSGTFKATSTAIAPDYIGLLAFGSPINATGMCDYRGNNSNTTVDYELVVPINNSGIATRLSTYFFFLDIE